MRTPPATTAQRAGASRKRDFKGTKVSAAGFSRHTPICAKPRDAPTPSPGVAVASARSRSCPDAGLQTKPAACAAGSDVAGSGFITSVLPLPRAVRRSRPGRAVRSIFRAPRPRPVQPAVAVGVFVDRLGLVGQRRLTSTTLPVTGARRRSDAAFTDSTTALALPASTRSPTFGNST